MRVHLGSDHAGLELKEHLLNWLADQGHEAVDHGPFVYDAADDYPVFCLRAAEGVAADRDHVGVVVLADYEKTGNLPPLPESALGRGPAQG